MGKFRAVNITTKTLDSIARKPRETSAPAEVWDSILRGFGVRVFGEAGKAPSTITYQTLMRGPDGKTARVKIGRHPVLKLAEARQAAVQVIKSIMAGEYVAKRVVKMQRTTDRQAGRLVSDSTVAELWAYFEKRHLPSLRDRTAAEYRRQFRTYIEPVLGAKAITAVKKSDIADLIADIRDGRGAGATQASPIMANRVAATISKLFQSAVDAEIIATNPAKSAIVRNLKATENRRETFLDPAQIARLAEALDAAKDQNGADLVRLLALTGARFGETASATWAQFFLDGEDAVWLKPGASTKQKRCHRVPLSAAAADLLRRMKESTTGEYLFPGRNGGHVTAIRQTWGDAKVAAGLPDDFRLHDLRHTYASVLASSGKSLLLIGQLLGHTQTQTTARYAHLHQSAQREAAEEAAAIITGKSQAEVIELARARRPARK